MLPELPAVEAVIKSGLASQKAGLRNNEDEAAQDTQPLITTPQKLQKTRSLSDSTPQLSPSPKFRETARASKDDHTVVAAPRTPRRPELLARGLSLQMPPREMPMPSPAHFTHRAPLSPQLDARNTYASPASVLPRRSRGAEFSRACTNLHHSTLPDQSSPDSSPTITQKGMMIPNRSHRNSMVLDSPNLGAGSWGMGKGDKMTGAGSVGSMSMFAESSSDSDEADAMDPDDNDDQMLMTPQAAKSGNPFATTPGHSTGNWSNMFSPNNLPQSFMHIQRARLHKTRNSRKSSSSASGYSSIASPVCASPPNGRPEGYFARESVLRKSGSSGSRRESLSLFANELNISSGNESGEESGAMPQTPQVVRRAVTARRGNLLPKSRQFGRIKAELWEESAPIDSEFRREAEIIRQVRENDEERPSITAQSSPSLLPTVPGLEGPLEGVPEEGSESNMSLDSTSTRGIFAAFNLGAIRNSNGRGFWNEGDPSQTPPPSFPGAASSVFSEDVNMDSPSYMSTTSTSLPSQSATVGPEFNGPGGFVSRASTPQPYAPPSAADGLKKSNKRRRDDDLDVNSIKRRAVSPGVSVTNSPVLSQSPAQRDSSLWGAATKGARDQVGSNGVQGHGPRSNSGGSTSMTPSFGPKRVGLQGMTDTSDGLMKMSIE